MKKIVIDEGFLSVYIKELQKYDLKDVNIDLENLAQIFYKIDQRVNLDQLFYSNLMLITIVVLLNLLYNDNVIQIKNNKIIFNETYILQLDVLKVCPDLINENISGDEEIIEYISKKNISPNLQYYQSYNTVDSLRRRMRTLTSLDDYKKNSFLFLGDDELFSVYFAYMNKGKSITVLDIDDKVIANIEEANKKYNLNIVAEKCDLLRGLPEQLYNTFDVFFASGLKDLGGVLVFIYTGLLSLKAETDSLGYFTYYDYNTTDGRDFQLKLQKKLIECNSFLDFISPCDQAVFPAYSLENIIKFIEKKDFLKDFMETRNCIVNVLRENNPFSADPLFPFFSVKPIYLARIRQIRIDETQIRKSLNILRRFQIK